MNFNVEDDLWNILGTAKYYLLFELCKINHPLWLRRYEAAAARVESNRPPQLIGSFFCFTGILSQFDPIVCFALLLVIALGMFTLWIWFMERTSINFNLLDTIDYVLSAFFNVPTADPQVLRTLTGRTIKILTGLFSMFYGAVIGWTFGFRVAENTQTVTDLLEDVNVYINIRQREARKIQTWWRKLKGQDKKKSICPPGQRMEMRWSKVLSSVREGKLKKMTDYVAKLEEEMANV